MWGLMTQTRAVGHSSRVCAQRTAKLESGRSLNMTGGIRQSPRDRRAPLNVNHEASNSCIFCTQCSFSLLSGMPPRGPSFGICELLLHARELCDYGTA